MGRASYGGLRMKAVGIVRKLDRLGRIVIPMELRRTYDLQIGSPVEIFVDGRGIVLRKHQPYCIFCGETEDIMQIHEKNVCKACLDAIRTYPLR